MRDVSAFPYYYARIVSRQPLAPSWLRVVFVDTWGQIPLAPFVCHPYLYIPLGSLNQLLLEMVDVVHPFDALHQFVAVFVDEADALVVRVVEM